MHFHIMSDFDALSVFALSPNVVIFGVTMNSTLCKYYLSGIQYSKPEGLSSLIERLTVQSTLRCDVFNPKANLGTCERSSYSTFLGLSHL